MRFQAIHKEQISPIIFPREAFKSRISDSLWIQQKNLSHLLFEWLLANYLAFALLRFLVNRLGNENNTYSIELLQALNGLIHMVIRKVTEGLLSVALINQPLLFLL